MRLFIAEKPSLARAIADALPGPQTKRRDFIECGGEDVVAWCAGHILELVEPEHYAPELKAWRLADLPIIPTEWRLAPTAPELLGTIRALLPRASRVVHTGDPDREGQLLVEEVLEFLGYRGPVDRLLISDLNLPAVRKALAEIQPNARYRGLYEAALARQRADWLFGMNLTRLYTLLGRAGGYDGVLSVGRVQTPLLGLIVRRDLEIERFHPRAYHIVRVEVCCSAGSFSATWQPPADLGAGLLDDSGRLLDREHAERVQRRATSAPATIASCSRARKAEAPPLPYALADLQIDAGKRLGLGPKQVVDATQALYETHRLVTYPRSDCAHLPEGQHDLATVVLAAVATNLPLLVPAVGKADRSCRSRAWNDKKVTAHHAIIPTAVAKPDAHLTAAERGIYELVARRYVAQFYPPHEFDEAKIEVLVGGDLFRAAGRQTVAEGWRVLAAEPPRDDSTEDRDDDSQALPLVRQGESVRCGDVTIVDKRTTPPKRFTESTLIQAMTGIARFVDDPKIKQLLRETDGIGTPATQAKIIDTLLERRFIEKRGRHVVSTPVARALVQILPAIATRPDMTALWEAAMRRIAEGKMSLDVFLGGVIDQLRKLVDSGRAHAALEVPGARRCAAPGCSGRLRLRDGRSGRFWSCTRYPDCRYTESRETTAPRPSRGARRRAGARSKLKERPRASGGDREERDR